MQYNPRENTLYSSSEMKVGVRNWNMYLNFTQGYMSRAIAHAQWLFSIAFVSVSGLGQNIWETVRDFFSYFFCKIFLFSMCHCSVNWCDKLRFLHLYYYRNNCVYGGGNVSPLRLKIRRAIGGWQSSNEWGWVPISPPLPDNSHHGVHISCI